MPYTVVYGMTFADLNKKINAKLSEGWKPVGSLVMHGTSEFYQPMLKGGSTRRERQRRGKRQTRRQATRSRR
jgi:hypothetical protein